MDPTELYSLFFQCTGWLSSFVDLAIAVAAFIRLRTTPAGILIGGSFGLMGLFGMVMRIVRKLAEPDFASMDFDLDYEAWMMQSAAISSVSTCGVVIFSIAIGIGFLLLPKSLEKLAQMEADKNEGADATA